MDWLSSARSFAAFSLALPKYVRSRRRPTIEEAKTQIKTALQTREERFLGMVERCIFGYPGSPYLPLLRAAGCEVGDLRTMVKKEGLEKTLRRLRDDGVYFSFEEFKGRRSVERSNVSFEVRSEEFDNPLAARHYAMPSGGSTGVPTRTWLTLDDRENWDAQSIVYQATHGLLGAPSVSWSAAELTSIVWTLAMTGAMPLPERFFATRVQRRARVALRYSLASKLIILAARAGGARFPQVEWIDAENPTPIVRWAEEKLRTHGRCRISTNISNGVRVAAAALENSVDLAGVSIVGGGEPTTPSKVREIDQSGARWIPFYLFTEGGQVGYGCANRVDGSDMHFLSDRFALVEVPRQVPGTNLTVDAFNFTALSDGARKILLNVEIDDFGILERRECGCLLEEVGYDQHLREIYSFQKLTGEGVTLVGSDIVRILEETLPARFGGGSLDYQLVEEEDEKSHTRLSLLIDPRVAIDDESQVIPFVIGELRASDAPSSMAGSIWAQAGTFRIIRQKPITTTGREKLMPLHTTVRRHLT